MAHQLTRRVGGAEKLDKIDAYYLFCLISKSASVVDKMCGSGLKSWTDTKE